MRLVSVCCQLSFWLSHLKLPIEPKIYDSKFYPGDVTDYYERYIVTRELGGYRVWHISYFVLGELWVKKLNLFPYPLVAIVAAKSSNRGSVSAIAALFAKTPALSCPVNAPSYIYELAIAENLDEFVEVLHCDRTCIEYATLYGRRVLDFENTKACYFQVEIKRCDLHYACEPTSQGFASAVRLPYFIARDSYYPAGTLIVRVMFWEEEAIAAGYANAISLEPIGQQKSDRLYMLDSNRAAALVPACDYDYDEL